MPFQFLGTAGAAPSAERDNTSLLFYTAAEALLVDCAGSPLHKILRAGVDAKRLRWVIITHAHVDHIYGLPSLIHTLWLTGRQAPLTLYALPEPAAIIRRYTDLFPIQGSGPFPLKIVEIEPRPEAPVLEGRTLRVEASPVEHSIPNAALRVTFAAKDERGTVVYSSDTQPCAAVVRLARGADVLIHEATFGGQIVEAERFGHSTATEAGRIAREAKVGRLILTHLDPWGPHPPEQLRAEAARAFGGPVEVAQELVPYSPPSGAA
ncbi:MAG: MBL fold metallo-hydrolase [Candidatus Methylomirabilales bacterium]